MPLAGARPIYRLTATSACQTGTSCSGTSDEVKTSVTYGSTGVANNLLPTSSSAGDGTGTLTATTATAYDVFGNIASVDGPLSGTADTTYYRYDAARRLVGTISPDPDGSGSMKMRAQRTTYNADGNATKVEVGTVNGTTDTDWANFTSLQEMDATYDTLGRKLTQWLVSGGTTYALTQTSYDAKGRVQCTAQRMNPSAYGSLPSDACTLGTSGSYGSDRIVKATYDNANQVTKTTSGYGTSDAADDVTSTYTNNGHAYGSGADCGKVPATRQRPGARIRPSRGEKTTRPVGKGRRRIPTACDDFPSSKSYFFARLQKGFAM